MVGDDYLDFCCKRRTKKQVSLKSTTTSFDISPKVLEYLQYLQQHRWMAVPSKWCHLNSLLYASNFIIKGLRGRTVFENTSR